MTHRSYIRKPEWLKIKLPDLRESADVMGTLNRGCLNTICSSGMCPNRGECWGNGTATFMIGGNICTRNCAFCAVATGNPRGVLDHGEIGRILDAVEELKLKHVVVTSVDRDDLPDGGASHWAELIRALKAKFEAVTIETLIPDFRGDTKCLDMVVAEKPDVISHNMETVRRLTPVVRSVATYPGSLQVLAYLHGKAVRTKTGIMLGLGETELEVLETMDDLRAVGCDILTIGQYLQPTHKHFPVREYVHPDKFLYYKEEAVRRGFMYVESSPFVRSSYHAEQHAR